MALWPSRNTYNIALVFSDYVSAAIAGVDPDDYAELKGLWEFLSGVWYDQDDARHTGGYPNHTVTLVNMYDMTGTSLNGYDLVICMQIGPDSWYTGDTVELDDLVGFLAAKIAAGVPVITMGNWNDIDGNHDTLGDGQTLPEKLGWCDRIWGASIHGSAYSVKIVDFNTPVTDGLKSALPGSLPDSDVFNGSGSAPFNERPLCGGSTPPMYAIGGWDVYVQGFRTDSGFTHAGQVIGRTDGRQYRTASDPTFYDETVQASSIVLLDQGTNNLFSQPLGAPCAHFGYLSLAYGNGLYSYDTWGRGMVLLDNLIRWCMFEI